MYYQLQRYQLKRPVEVYRCQLMSNAEIEYLRQNTGQFVSVNSFLSTTTDRKVAKMYIPGAGQHDTLERVLFVITADPAVVETKPFADISKISHFTDEAEVLFMLGSIFRINFINRDGDKIWNIHMSLCSDDEHSLKPILERMKKQIGTEKTTLYTLGKVLWMMGKFDLAYKYYNRCINELPEKDPSRLAAYKDLAIITSMQNNYDESLYWHQQSQHGRIEFLATGTFVSLSVVIIVSILGAVCGGIICGIAGVVYGYHLGVSERKNTTSDVNYIENSLRGLLQKIIQIIDCLTDSDRTITEKLSVLKHCVNGIYNDFMKLKDRAMRFVTEVFVPVFFAAAQIQARRR
ncbi:unnamed protein product [Adineta steineri]|uniref:Tetratricopeptide repeat protein n=1 Tax=Adineta steineri TaxID=433720 RepID=A0A813UYL2_9BILA|nr:unnamed protein product [Adineta steineri]CAF0752635.1 unnamed protein product [Adineta steineri]CAF0832626.1 unnamed protein product [Adineta steineri]